MKAITKVEIIEKPINQLLIDIKNGTHIQFYFYEGSVMCKCGSKAVKFRDGYLCSSITVAGSCHY